MINVTVFACANQRLQIGTAKYTKDAKEKQFEFSRILRVSRFTILSPLVVGIGYGCFGDYIQRAVPEAGVPMPGGRYEAILWE